MKQETRIPGFSIRKTEKKDVPLILTFIKKIAEYEKLSDQVVTNESMLEKCMFSANPVAEAIIGEYENQPVGFAVFFQNFSTFLGKPGIYLEDIFVLEEMRGKGFGTQMLRYLAKLAKERDCGRFEWAVLDWNTPSIEFYKSLGAEIKNEWLINRLSGAALDKLASEF
jgi:GNAT superfamily N-acetyltransferase